MVGIKMRIFLSRQVKTLVAFGGYPGLASFIPDFFRVPLWLMHFGSYKF